MGERLTTALLCASWLVLISAIVYLTGGTQNAYVHLLYLPVILVAARFGVRGGLIAGAVGGVLMAFIPLDTTTGLLQAPISIVTRLVAFVAVGGYSGWLTDRLRREQAEVQRLLEESVVALVNTIESGHSWTSGHSLRVTAIAMLLGRKLRLSETDMYILRTGSLLHDIGKLGLPLEVLDKRGPLTQDERSLVQTHPVEGDRILKAFHHPRADAIRDIVRHHHERLDGSGYPDGLRGDQISLFARIVAIADVYEAMTSSRPYRPAMTPTQALSQMEREAATGRLDTELVVALYELVYTGQVPSSQSVMGHPA